MNELQKISSFRFTLAIAETIEEIDKIDNLTAAMADLAKREKIGLDKQNELGRFRIEIAEKKGAWLNRFYPHGGDKPSVKDSNFEARLNRGSKLPVSYDESANSRKIEKTKPDVKSKVMQEIEEKGEVITPSIVLKHIKIIEKQDRKVQEGLTPKMPDDKYRILYADPPWKYGEEQHVDFGNIQTKVLGSHYPSMSIKELCELPVKEITAINAVLFLWVTSPLLEECFPMIKAWGFKYKTSMVWDKIKHNVGNYVSVRHELLLICTKGACTPDFKKLFDSVQSIERTEHSKKPEEFRKIIDTIYTHGKRIELFRRGDAPEGWDTWGNEA